MFEYTGKTQRVSSVLREVRMFSSRNFDHESVVYGVTSGKKMSNPHDLQNLPRTGIRGLLCIYNSTANSTLIRKVEGSLIKVSLSKQVTKFKICSCKLVSFLSYIPVCFSFSVSQTWIRNLEV